MSGTPRFSYQTHDPRARDDSFPFWGTMMAAATETPRQEFTFQAEIKQLLHLLSHSLYQSREIAIRELISNASDALDKMRYVVADRRSPARRRPARDRRSSRDEEERQLVIRDNGVGMTHDELVTNLGTIAHSGSGEFLKNLSGEARAKADLSLIGQFGVGFYSAFMIADRVQVRTRSYLEEIGLGVGVGGDRQLLGRAGRGPPAPRHRDHPPAQGRRQGFRRRPAASRTSSGAIPASSPTRSGWARGEVINDQKPIWVEPKSQVTDEQYTRFYQHLTHHTDETPLWHLHLAVDSPIQFRAILYCPPTNLERYGFARLEHGVNLCAKRVLVQSDCRELLPDYLRFLRGLVDSEDLPLNVSRETLQDNTVIRRIRTSLVKGGLRPARPDWPRTSRTTYKKFYDQFGRMLKEGAIVDPANRERIAKLLRFTSSLADDADAKVSLDDVHRADARGPEADLLPGRSRPGVDQEEPEPGDLPPPRTRSPLPERADRRVRDERAAARIEGSC